MELRTSVVVWGALAAVAAIGCGDDSAATGSGGGGRGQETTATTTASTTGSTTTAVSSSGSGGAGGGTGGTGGAEPVYALTEGTYDSRLDEVDPSECGNIGLTGSFRTWILSWSDETHFTLDDEINDVSTTCVRTGLDATCEAYTFSHVIDADTRFIVTTEEPVVTILTTESFQYAELDTCDCTGPGCDAFGAQFGATFPCALGIRATYTLAP